MTTFSLWRLFMKPPMYSRTVPFKCSRLLSSASNSSSKNPQEPVLLTEAVQSVKQRKVLFDEKELSENFIRGWGPGGQKVNKISNAVWLKHEPTGIVVKCHDTRSLERNRELAREYLNQKLDEHFNGSESAVAVMKKEEQAKENNRYARAKKRLEMKLAFKQREGLMKRRPKDDGETSEQVQLTREGEPNS